MTINVYWTRLASDLMSPLRIPAPEPLLKHINYKEFLGPNVSRCPAIVDDLKNIFVIKSPITIKLSIVNGTNAKIEHQSPEFGKLFFGEAEGKLGLHQIASSYLFFADKSLMMTQLPAYYDVNSFTENTFQITGSFDIGRWFRASGKPTFLLKPGKTVIDIKEGDALMYIKFNTTEKISLVEFDFNEIQEMKSLNPANACVGLKDNATSLISLERCYQYFEQFKMRQKVLKLIKRNKI